MNTFSKNSIDRMYEVELKISKSFTDVDMTADHNQWKVIHAFQKHKVSDFHFANSTGYAYHDRGRETLDQVFAEIFGTESAIVRPHIVSGTHAISVALFGVLRPNDRLLYITGKPYDTLSHVIGKSNDKTGSLQEWGIVYEEIGLSSNHEIDWQAVAKAMEKPVRMIGIQRSRGYAWRCSFTIEKIKKMVEFVKSIQPHCLVFVDNCYGEFTEQLEPTEVGVDLMAGSLIKNPGGGISPTGGYIVGKHHLVRQCAERLTAPGIGDKVGAMMDTTRLFFQGLFIAPLIVSQALKGAIFAAGFFHHLGFETSPTYNEKRTDLIQAIRFQNEEQIIAFIQGIQRGSAIDAHVIPEPWSMPGYLKPVIMAAGTFIQGGSLELSADAPIGDSNIAYLQGGLTYAHAKYGVLTAVEYLIEKKLL